jgi:sigma-B regulation protein RsbU (phosphoserine phosphatase)
LACIEDGEFAFSGLHQDIFIYRGEEGSVDAVETNGMWIGLLPDVEDMLKIDRLKIRPGDSMLLFTDGLVEALGPDGEMFGNDRLKNILYEHGGKNPQEVRQVIQKELEPYDKPDDVTFVVIHRRQKD